MPPGPGRDGFITPCAPNPSLAIGLMLLATAFIAGATVLAKAIGTGTLGAPLHPLQISHGRFLLTFAALCTVATLLRPRIEKPDLKLPAARSLFGRGGVTLMFAAVAFIPLSHATAISFLNPLFAMVLAIPLLGEKVGPVRWSAAAIALVGPLSQLRPWAGVIQPGALLTLGAAAIMGALAIVAGGIVLATRDRRRAAILPRHGALYPPLG